MITFALLFPNIDPVAVQIGPIAIRWYALAYIAGILLGWRYVLYLAERPPYVIDRQAVDDFVVWATLGVILGGRLGYVLFYKPGYYLFQPWEALFLWHGGMSFHGGLIGVLAAIWLFARKHGISPLALGDIMAIVTPIGLLFGRIANFINAELYGRVTDVPWAMIFPTDATHQPRHPSQLYQATLEGLVLLVVLGVLARRVELRRRPGFFGGCFLVGYAIARLSGELFREPDAHLGFIIGPVTMGQLLSLPMLVAGIYLIVTSARRPKLPLSKPAK